MHPERDIEVAKKDGDRNEARGSQLQIGRVWVAFPEGHNSIFQLKAVLLRLFPVPEE